MKSHITRCVVTLAFVAAPTFSVGESQRPMPQLGEKSLTLYCALPTSPIFEVVVNRTKDSVQFRGGPAFAVWRHINNDGVLQLHGGTSTFQVRIDFEDSPMLTFRDPDSDSQTASCAAARD